MIPLRTCTLLAGLGFAASATAATVSLQAGVGGQGDDIIEDAMLIQGAADDNFGGRVDFDAGVIANSNVRTTVMRFKVTDVSALFVAGVPQFSSIDSITLTLTQTSTSLNPANMDVRVMTAAEAQGDWVEGTGTNAASGGDAGTATYSERQEGVAGTAWPSNYTRGMGAPIGVTLATVSAWPGDGGTAVFTFSGTDLTDLVNGWATGNNEGILINDVNRSGFARWNFDSSEAGTLADRPKLDITYTPIPEPSTAVLILLGSAGFFHRRRRA